jgi:hypothetical protein
MLDFNNLNYFPSLFEDLSKPRETYTIIQCTRASPEGASSSFAQLNNTDVSLYKHYTNKAVNVSYLENAILKHISSESVSYNTINIENTTVSSVAYPYPTDAQAMDQLGANLPTDIISHVTPQTKANPGLVEVTAKANNVISPRYEATATQKTNTPSISYNLNRDSVSSTYSKYFYSEDTSTTTDKVTIQVNDKAVTVTTEQASNIDLSNSLSTNIKNSKLRIEPSSPYSPSIISSYTDTQAKTSDLVSNALRSATKNISFSDDLTVPEVKPTKITPFALFEDYTVANTENIVATRTNFDLTIPEAKPTIITAPLLDDDFDYQSTHIPRSSKLDDLDLTIPEAKPNIITAPWLDDYDLPSTVQANTEPVTQATLKLEKTSSLHANQEDIDIRDLSNAKSTIVKNNKHIMDIELNLVSLQDRINSINDESSSLLQEKAELTNKLNNNNHTVESFTERTVNNDNPLYTTYKNAYNSFMQ